MKPLKYFINAGLVLCIAVAGLSIFPAHSAQAAPSAETAQAEDADLLVPDLFLNPDGTLRLDGNQSGSFDLEGWDVALDPALGPVFSPVANTGEWAPMATGGAFNGDIVSILVNGTDIYVGGYFTNAGSNPAADGIAKWDGTQWTALSHANGDGVLYGVQDMIFVGSDLYVAGSFSGVVDTTGALIPNTAYLAKWNGTAWSAVPGGASAVNSWINSLVHNATANDLYVGGEFTNFNNIPEADRVAKLDLDTSTWSALSSNGAGDGALNDSVYDIALDSSGNLYVGGDFTNVNNGGTAIPEADIIAKWDGTNWSALGSNGAGDGPLSSNADVNTIVVDASNNVYAGGWFENAGGDPTADHVAKWNGSTWSGLGSNGSGNGIFDSNGYVEDLLLAGTTLYVASDNTFVNNPELNYLSKFDTTTSTWSGVGGDGSGGSSMNDDVYALAYSGGTLYAGGSFGSLNNNGTVIPKSAYFGVFDGTNWSTHEGTNGAIGNIVNSVAIMGSDVYIGGYFYDLGGNSAIDNVAKWDGTSWSSLGVNGYGNGLLSGSVNVLAVKGTDLYAGGSFTYIYNNGTTTNIPAADRIARWSTTTNNWYALGSGTSGDGAITNNAVFDIAFNGSSVYVAGGFTNVVNKGTTLNAADYIAKFDGTNWSALGSNGAGNGSLNSYVSTLQFVGTQLYVGGNFTDVNNNGTVLSSADYLAKWTGSSWAAPAVTTPFNSWVKDMALSGSDLYITGSFSNLNGDPNADAIVKFNTVTNTWSALGANASTFNGGSISSVYLSNGQVYVGGSFTNVVNNNVAIPEADYVARWNGTDWLALGNNGAGNGSLNNSVVAFGTVSNDLIVGGYFTDTNNNGTVLPDGDYLAAFGIDTVIPTVTINQAVGQADPTNAQPINFDVVFSESVTGFDNSDVVVTGTAPGTKTVNVTGSGTTYSVSVSGITGSGTVIVNIPAGMAKDAFGNNNLASTSTDKTVTYQAVLSSVPTLLSPANAAVLNTLQPTLDWSDTNPAPVYYQVQISTVSNFSTTIVNESNLLSSTYTVMSDLAPGTLHYWRARSFNVYNIPSAFSVARTFKTPLGSTTLIAPNGVTTETLRPTFSWNPTLGATSYLLQVSKNNTFTQIIHTGNSNTLTYTPAVNLPGNATLYWRVAAKTSAVTGPFYSPLSFQTVTPPSTPAPVSPTDNFLTTNLNQKIDWSDSTINAGTLQKYEVQISTSPTFAAPEIADEVLVSEYVPGIKLTAKTTYYWRVRTWDTTNHYSNWSVVRKFRTAIKPTTLVSPTDGSNELHLRPSFSWDAAPDATGYTLQISKNSTFTQITSTVQLGSGSTTYTPTTNLLANITLYWRVQVKHSTHGPSAFTAARSILMPNPPSTPSLLSPAHNAFTTNTNPVFTWSKSTLPVGANFAHYQFQMDDNPNFTTPFVDTTITNINTPSLAWATLGMGNIPHGSFHYWRVRAVNSSGNYGAWTPARLLKTAVLPPALFAPADGGVTFSLRPIFDWNSSPNGDTTITGYTIQISKNSLFTQIVHTGSANGPTYTPTVSLPANVPLWWRVAGKSPEGSSVFSAPFMFNSANPPSTPNLVSPANNALTTDHTPVFIWAKSTLPASEAFLHYQFQISDTLNFTTLVTDELISNINTTQFDYTTTGGQLVPNSSYFWRVRAVNTMNEYSVWSTVRTVRTTLAVPNLLTPMNGSLGGSLTPTFDWDDVSGATSYTIQVSTSPTFGTTVVNTTVVTSTYTPVINLPAGKTLYWRVRANGTNGPSAWSALYEFDTP